MSGPDKFMPTYWGDYAKDTGNLNNAGHGAYLMLIKHYWCSGKPLPNDDASLWRIACCDSVGAWKKLRPAIAPFFQDDGGQWRHGRIDRELEKAAERYERRLKAGQKGNNARWGKDGNATGEVDQEPPDATDPASQCDPNAIPMRSQPQPHLLTEKKEKDTAQPLLEQEPAIRRSEASQANVLIAEFDTVIVEVWGEAQRRPWPTGTDSGVAQRWLRDGVTADLVRAVAEPRMRRMKAQDKRPPHSLSFLDGAISDTLAEAARTGTPVVGTPADPEQEAAAKRYSDAVNAWADNGREGPSPKPEQFGWKRVKAMVAA